MPDAQHRKAPTPRAKEIRDHRDLRVWRKSIKLREECQAIVEGFPPERASMARQIRDLSARVPSRIEQGNDQGYHAPYLELLGSALDDLDRLERRLIRAHEVGDLQSTVGDRVLARLADIRRMVRKLVRSLEEARQRRSGVWSGDSG